MKRFILIMLLLLLGCANTPDDPKETYWSPEPGDWKSNGEVRFHTLDFQLDEGKGHGYDGYHIKNKDGSCDIFIMRKAPDRRMAERHEEIHCEGYTHVGYGVRYGSISRAPVGSKFYGVPLAFP